MRLLLCDDHALFRQGIRLLLMEIQPEVDIVEAATVGQTIASIESGERFDLILLDLRMPDCPPQEGVRWVAENAQGTPIVVVSASDDPIDIRLAFSAGAHGYILKSSPIEVLRHALSLLLAGSSYFPVPASALDDSSITLGHGGNHAGGGANGGDHHNATEVIDADVEKLTPRQKQVLAMLAEGCSNKEIARRLGMLENTVKVHVRDIMRKLKVNNRTQAALIANRAGLRSDDSLIAD